MTTYEKLREFNNRNKSCAIKLRVNKVTEVTAADYLSSVTLLMNEGHMTLMYLFKLIETGKAYCTNTSVLKPYCDCYDRLSSKETAKDKAFLDALKKFKFHTEYKRVPAEYNLNDWSKLKPSEFDITDKCYLNGIQGSAYYYLGMSDYSCLCYLIKDAKCKNVKKQLLMNFAKGKLALNGDEAYEGINAMKLGSDLILCCIFNTDDFECYELTDHFSNSMPGIEYEYSEKGHTFEPTGYLMSWDSDYYAYWFERQLKPIEKILQAKLKEMGYIMEDAYNSFLTDLALSICNEYAEHKPYYATKLFYKVIDIFKRKLKNTDFDDFMPADALLVDAYLEIR